MLSAMFCTRFELTGCGSVATAASSSYQGSPVGKVPRQRHVPIARQTATCDEEIPLVSQERFSFFPVLPIDGGATDGAIMILFRIVIASVIALGPAIAAAQQSDWRKYVVAETGANVDVPTAIFSSEAG